MSGHGRRVGGVRFSATGALLATSGNDGVVRLWNPTVGGRSGRSRAHPTGCGPPSSARPSRCWPRPTTKGVLRLVERRHRPARALAADRDRAALGAGLQPVPEPRSRPPTTTTWCACGTAAPADRSYTLTGHRGRVRAIAYSPDGSAARHRLRRLAGTAMGRRVGAAHAGRSRGTPTGCTPLRSAAARWPARRGTPPLGCGTPRTVGAGTCSPGTPDGCGRRRSTPRGSCSPRRATTWSSGCGTPQPGTTSRRSRGTPTASPRSPSTRGATSWPAAAPTGPRSSGPSRAGRPRGT